MFAKHAVFELKLAQVEKTFLTAIFKSAIDSEQSLANSEHAGLSSSAAPKSLTITSIFSRKF